DDPAGILQDRADLAGATHPDLDEARFVALADGAREPPSRRRNLLGAERRRAGRDALRALVEHAQVVVAELQSHFIVRENALALGVEVEAHAGPVEFIVDGWHVDAPKVETRG